MAVAAVIVPAGMASAASVTAVDNGGSGFSTTADSAFVTGNVLTNNVLVADAPSTSVEVFYTDFNGTHSPVITGSTDVSAAIAPNLGFMASGSGSSTAGTTVWAATSNYRCTETDTFNRSRVAGGFQAERGANAFAFPVHRPRRRSRHAFLDGTLS